MKIKLSQIPEYRDFIKFFHAGEHAKAEQALDVCMRIAEAESDADALAHLTQCRGELCFLKGDVDNARRCYLEAEELDAHSPLAKYEFAKFLATKLNAPRETIEKCEEIEETLLSAPWKPTDEDFSSNYYLAQCYALDGYCCCLVHDFRSAEEKLLRLLALDEDAIDYGIKLSEQLLKNGIAVEQSRAYLRRLLSKISQLPDRDSYADLTRQIEQILKTTVA
jgi:tetratricopeptide (TPR) repeat protein